MIDLREIRSVTEFQRNVKEYVGQLKTTKTPMVLTVNGKAELVVQNAGSYQELLDRLEHAEAIAGIRQGMAEFERGEGQPARAALEALRDKLNAPR
ncbi:type II toxin-antitoxin system Phd/YefM family antitoxin [Methylomagnum sp.]